MANADAMGEVITTDILIIGGGLAGLVAAIKAKEYPVDVLLVDKQTIGWSGKAPKVGGGLWVMLPDDDVDKMVEYHVKNVGQLMDFGMDIIPILVELRESQLNIIAGSVRIAIILPVY